MNKNAHCVIFDIDGTLADTHKLFHLADFENLDFDAFHRTAVYAPALRWTLKVARNWDNIGVPVIISTARSDKYVSYTKEWLRIWFKNYSDLFMRCDGDYREDHEVKEDHLWDIQRLYGRVLRVYDDNPHIINMYRANDIPTVTLPNWPGLNGSVREDSQV